MSYATHYRQHIADANGDLLVDADGNHIVCCCTDPPSITSYNVSFTMDGHSYSGPVDWTTPAACEFFGSASATGQPDVVVSLALAAPWDPFGDPGCRWIVAVGWGNWDIFKKPTGRGPVGSYIYVGTTQGDQHATDVVIS